VVTVDEESNKPSKRVTAKDFPGSEQSETSVTLFEGLRRSSRVAHGFADSPRGFIPTSLRDSGRLRCARYSGIQRKRFAGHSGIRALTLRKGTPGSMLSFQSMERGI
jgi:hypothetical protein